jgi:hypothetical protein
MVSSKRRNVMKNSLQKIFLEDLSEARNKEVFRIWKAKGTIPYRKL